LGECRKEAGPPGTIEPSCKLQRTNLRNLKVSQCKDSADKMQDERAWPATPFSPAAGCGVHAAKRKERRKRPPQDIDSGNSSNFCRRRLPVGGRLREPRRNRRLPSARKTTIKENQ